jgi:hypothetical protein
MLSLYTHTMLIPFKYVKMHFVYYDFETLESHGPIGYFSFAFYLTTLFQ